MGERRNPDRANKKARERDKHNLKYSIKGVPWRSSGWDSALSLLRAQVRSLVRDLRSLQTAWRGQKIKKKKYGIKENKESSEKMRKRKR